MRSRARSLLDKSIEAMLAAVEVYNKPSFAYREEAFSVFAVNAWELLLKARILQIDNNRLSAILEYERRTRADGSPSTMLYRKMNRAGNSLTLGLFKAHDRLVNEYKDALDPAIRGNLEALVEIRDNAIHFFNKDLKLEERIYEVGAATLKNYVTAARQWFGVDLGRYRVFLLPLAFLSSIQVAEAVALNAEERHMLTYLDSVRSKSDDPDKDFNVALNVEIKLKRSKDPKAIAITSSNAPDAIKVTVDEEDIREKYPWSYDILTARLQKRYTDFKVNAKYHDLRKDLELNGSCCRERLLDPGNPKSARKKFYNPNIVKEFDAHYERAKLEVPNLSEGSAA